MNFAQKITTIPSKLKNHYWRNIIRKKILSTQPIEIPQSGNAEIHLLTSEEDFLNALWSLKTFLNFSQHKIPVCIHDDGSLSDNQIHLLKDHFPGAIIYLNSENKEIVSDKLKELPHCLNYFNKHPLSIKAFAFGERLKAKKLIIMDSDLIFFRNPELIITRATSDSYDTNCVNAGLNPKLNISFEEAEKKFQCNVNERFNSGFGILQKETFNFEWFEDFLDRGKLLDGHIWRIEQTLIALASAKIGTELLPTEYLIRLGPGLNENTIMKHYVGPVRNLMYTEGLRHIYQNKSVYSFLNK